MDYSVSVTSYAYDLKVIWEEQLEIANCHIVATIIVYMSS